LRRRDKSTGVPKVRRPDGGLGAPRYHQVYVTVRSWVHDGSYRPGEQIPTEPELCKLFGVSRVTLRKAIDALEREGWLSRRQGRGTFARFPGGLRPISLDLRSVMQQVSDLAALTGVAARRVDEVDPDEETRAALGLADGERVRRESHVRLLGGAPMGLITTFVPLDIAARLANGVARDQPMFMLLEAGEVGISTADQFIGATLAAVDAAQALGVEVGAPLLRLTRVVKDQGGRAVERVIGLYRADAYQYHLHLESQGAAPKPRP
jgi:GntR family transcriptional regulator